MKHLDPSKLKVGDILLTTDISPFACITRARTWPGRSIFDMTLGTHAAMVCDRGAGLFYASEMQPDGGPDMGELWKYDRPQRSWLGHVCAVKRHPQIEISDFIRSTLNAYMIQMHAFKVRYGFGELLRYVWPKLEGDPYTQVCSQWIVQALHQVKIAVPDKWLLTTEFPALVSPADIQRWDEPRDVYAWK